jgi:hypothetical protein
MVDLFPFFFGQDAISVFPFFVVVVCPDAISFLLFFGQDAISFLIMA